MSIFFYPFPPFSNMEYLGLARNNHVRAPRKSMSLFAWGSECAPTSKFGCTSYLVLETKFGSRFSREGNKLGLLMN